MSELRKQTGPLSTPWNLRGLRIIPQKLVLGSSLRPQLPSRPPPSAHFSAHYHSYGGHRSRAKRMNSNQSFCQRLLGSRRGVRGLRCTVCVTMNAGNSLGISCLLPGSLGRLFQAQQLGLWKLLSVVQSVGAEFSPHLGKDQELEGDSAFPPTPLPFNK